MDESTQMVKTAVEVAKAPIEIIQVPVQGVTMGFQTVMGGAYGIQAIASFAGMLRDKMQFEQAVGGSGVKELIEVSGGDVQTLSVKNQDAAYVDQMMQEYQIPHCILPDRKNDPESPTTKLTSDMQPAEETVFMFPTNATPRVNLILQQLGYGKTQAPEEYIEEITTKLASPAVSLAGVAVHNPDQAGVLKQGGTSPEQQRIIEENQIAMKLADDTRQAFSLNIDSLVVSQDEDTILTKVPGTWSDRGSDMVRFSKREAFLLDQGQTVLVFQRKDEPVQVLNAKNEIVRTTDYGTLHRQHYAKIKDLSRHRAVNAKNLQSPPVSG